MSMAAIQKVPDKTQLRRYLDQGLTQAQIVEEWEKKSGLRVSRAAIGMAIERYGLKSANDRQQYPDMLPWRLGRHTHRNDARMLRLVARKQRGLPVSPKEETRLAKWLADLNSENAVIFFDERLPTGFKWIEREPRHGDDLIDRSNALESKSAKGSGAVQASSKPLAPPVRAAKKPE